MQLTIEDLDAHAATLRMGAGNKFWASMWRFVNTFSGDDSERRAWRNFLAAWRTEVGGSEVSDVEVIGG